MLHSIGRRQAPERVVDLLQECHYRIRSFLRAAERLATSERLDTQAAAAVAADIHRYFSNAFPLHLADEDELITPRLRGASAEVESAVATMRNDHVVQASDIGRLIDICGELAAGRDWGPHLSTRLSQVTAALAPPLEAHLQLEERVIFPAVATLADGVQEAIRTEMRRRREADHRSPPAQVG